MNITILLRNKKIAVKRSTLLIIPWFEHYFNNHDEHTDTIEIDRDSEPLSDILNFCRTHRKEFLKESRADEYLWYGLKIHIHSDHDPEFDKTIDFEEQPLNSITILISGERRVIRKSLLVKLGMVHASVDWINQSNQISDDNNNIPSIDIDIDHFDLIVHYLETGENILTPDALLTMEYLSIPLPPKNDVPFSPPATSYFAFDDVTRHTESSEHEQCPLVPYRHLISREETTLVHLNMHNSINYVNKRTWKISQYENNVLHMLILHTPGRNASASIYQVDFIIGGILFWSSSIRNILLRNRQLSIPMSDDPSYLPLSICADLSENSGMPIGLIYHQNILVNIRYDGGSVHLLSYNESQNLSRASTPIVYNVIQFQEKEIIIDDNGQCIDVQLNFRLCVTHFLLILLRERETQLFSTFTSNEPHPLVRITMTINESIYIDSSWQELQIMHPLMNKHLSFSKNLPKGVYYVHGNINSSLMHNNLKMTVRTTLPRGRIILVAINENTIQINGKLGICGIKYIF